MPLPRYPVAATHGAIATPHYLATEAGLHMLRLGGTAVDAAIAANAVLHLTEPHMCGLGGDLFMFVFSAADGRLHALNGSGRSPYAVDLRWFQDRGITQMPLRGYTSVSVPGIIDGWLTAHARFGRLPLKELLAPAIEYAEGGFPLRRHALKFMTRGQQELGAIPVAARNYLPGGKLPALGQIIRNPEIGASLRMVVEEGRKAMYEGGALGQAVVKTCNDLGWPLSARDLADHHSEWVEPISGTYRGLTIYEFPPPNQGLATLLALNILEEFDLPSLRCGSFETAHRQVEAIKAAFLVRNRVCVDPAIVTPPLGEVLSKEYAARLREGIDSHRASLHSVGDAAQSSDTGGDTIFLCAADREGNYVSLIQSNYASWGSGIMAGDMGFFLHNRGSGFHLDPSHPNRFGPHQLPFHTLIPAMAYKDGKPWLLFGTRGADAQPQTQTQFLCNLVDFGMNLQEALDAPRWRLMGTYLRPQPNPLLMEHRFSDDCYSKLAAAGHDVKWSEDADDDMGHAQAIMIDRDHGVLYAAADPRSDGSAAGW